MTGTTLLALGLLGFAVLLGLGLVEQRRVATSFRQRLLVPVMGLMVATQGLLAFRGSDEEKFALGLMLCLLVVISFIILAVAGLRAGRR